METYYETETIRIKLKAQDSATESKPRLTDPQAVIDFCRSVYADLDADQEHFTVLAVNKANKVNGFKVVHSGGIDETLVSPGTVFRFALLFGATAIIVVHNHPSGRKEPSRADMDITRKLKEVGEVLHIKLLDHLILTAGDYFSFQEHGIA